MTRHNRLLGFVLALGLSGWLRFAVAEEPSLVRSVPNDVGICIEFDGLATRAEKLFHTEIYGLLQAIPPIATWSVDDGRHLKRMVRLMAPRMGMEEQHLWEGLYGGKVVFAVWPAPEGESAQLTSLLLNRVSNPPLWERFVAALTENIPMTSGMGNVTTLKREYAGHTYIDRHYHRGDIERHAYIATLGDIGVTTTSEQVMHKVLELQAPGSEQESLAEDHAYRTGLKHVGQSPVMRMFVRPMHWARMIEDALANPEDPTDVMMFRGLIVDLWQAGEGWLTSIDLDEQLTIESFHCVDNERLPPAFRELGKSLEGPAEVFTNVPPDVAFALASHVDMQLLDKAVRESSDPRSRRGLETVQGMFGGLFIRLEAFDQLLQSMGPNVGFYMKETKLPAEADGVKLASTAADDDEESDEAADDAVKTRADWALAMQTRPIDWPDPEQPGPTIDSTLRDAVQWLAGLHNARLQANPDDDREPISVATCKRGDLTITRVDEIPVLPIGDRACFGGGKKYLTFASSEDLVCYTSGPPSADCLANNPRLKAGLTPHLQNPGHIMYFNSAAFMQLAEEHPDLVISTLARMQGRSRTAAERDLEAVSKLLRLCRTVVICGAVEEAGISVSMRADMYEEP